MADTTFTTGTVITSAWLNDLNDLFYTTLSGATTAAGVRSAVSAAKSGANSDITSLTGLSTPLSVAQGGTGAATLTANNVLLGNGTSAPGFVAPGTSGNVLTSNGTTWTSTAPSVTATGNHCVSVMSGNGHGSTNTKIRRFSNVITNVGTAITYADSVTNGASFTINETGLYNITYSDNYTAGNTYMGASLNSANLTTNFFSCPNSERLMITKADGNVVANCSRTVYLTAGDVIRAHTNGLADVTDGQCHFAITKVGA